MDLARYLDKFSGKKILVLGDLMLDKYIWGNVSRISPEAPVPIVLVKHESFAPGGAANVANNIAEMGGTVTMIGVIGSDPTGLALTKELQKRGIVTDNLVIDSDRPTIEKVRVIGHSQQLIRVDYEKHDGFGPDILAKMQRQLASVVKDVDAVIVSDYAKGIVNKDVMSTLLSLAAKYNKLVIADPKPKNKELYMGTYVMLPNHVEAQLMAGIEDENDTALELVGKTLVADYKCNVIITRGEKGMAIFSKDSRPISYIPTKAKEVYDVTGAGDTVTATLALGLACGASLHDAALIANHAAGVVVGKVGTATATIAEIRKSIENE